MHRFHPLRLVSWAQHQAEELIALLASWGLVAAQVIAGLVIMSDGAFALSAPALDWLWVACQVAGIDTQLIVTLSRACRAYRDRRWGAMSAWALVSLPLLGITVFMSWVYSMMRSEGMSEGAALAITGIPGAAWNLARVIVGVFVIAVSIVARLAHTAPAVAALVPVTPTSTPPTLPPPPPDRPSGRRPNVQTASIQLVADRPRYRRRDGDSEARTRARALAWIADYRQTHGRWPSARTVAAQFSVATATGGSWLAQVRAAVDGGTDGNTNGRGAA